MHNVSRSLIAVAVSCSLVSAATWLTFGGDAQRSGWAREEATLTKDNVKGLQLQWKLKLDNEPKQLNALTVPVVINPVYTNHGSFEYVIVAGSSDNLYVIDADTGKLAWQKHFTNEVPPPVDVPPEGDYFCPDALNDTPVIGTSKDGPTAYVISIDGKLHALNLVNGEDRFPPKQFVPAYSKNWSLNLAGDVVYTTISQGCHKVKNGVAAMDLKSPDKTVSFFQSDTFGGGIWGRGGAAVGATGVVFGATGDGPVDASAGKYADTVLGLSGRELKLLDYFTPANANYLTRKDLDMGNTSPVVFPYKGRELLVCSGKEGTLFLLDAKSLGGQTHSQPLFQARYLNEENDIAGRGVWGAFATWEDAKGTRWVYAPAWGPMHSKAQTFPLTNGATPNGSLMAFKVEDKDGQPVLTPAWVSHDMAVPEPPVVANGVVFAIASGEFTRQVKENGQLYTTQERIAASTANATLYAFDAETGKELYASGKTISSFTHLGGLALNDGRIFITTHDSTVYAFGLNGE
jgi:outer membrane protein assembly factor BamB